jgi:hypothetical protein
MSKRENRLIVLYISYFSWLPEQVQRYIVTSRLSEWTFSKQENVFPFQDTEPRAVIESLNELKSAVRGPITMQQTKTNLDALPATKRMHPGQHLGYNSASSRHAFRMLHMGSFFVS